MKVTERNPIVEAIQYTGDNLRAVKQWIAEQTSIPAHVTGPDGILFVAYVTYSERDTEYDGPFAYHPAEVYILLQRELRNHEVITLRLLRITDWLVTSSEEDGRIYSVHDDQFQKEYKQVE